MHAAHFAGHHAEAACTSSNGPASVLQDAHIHKQLQDQPSQHPSSRVQRQYRPATTSEFRDSWESTTANPAPPAEVAAGNAVCISDMQHVQEAPQQLQQQPFVHSIDYSSTRRSRQQQHRQNHRGVDSYHQTQQQQQQASQLINLQQRSSLRSHKRPGKHKQPGRSPTDRAQYQDQVASKQLTAAISSCRSWQQLHHLLLQDEANMNHIHACALLSTTSKLAHYCQLDSQEQQQFAEYYVAALQLAFSKVQTTAGPREISSMLWAVAKVGLHPGPDWLEAFLQAAAPQVQQMNAQDVGLLVWSLARFKHAPDQQWQQQLLATTQQKMNRFDAQGLCNMLWGLAVLGIQPSRQWLTTAVAAAQRQWTHFQPQGLAILVWSVAKLGCRVDQDWLQCAADAARRQLHLFKPAEVAMFCHAWAKLHAHPSRSSSSTAQQQQQRQQFLQHVQDVSAQSVHRLTFVEAANMVWALGVLNQQPQQQWLAAALQQLQSTMQHADGKALANACYGLARMQQQPDVKFWDAVWQQIPHVLGSSGVGQQQQQGAGLSSAAAAEYQGSTADGQAVATLLLSLAKLGVGPGIPHPIAAALLDAVQQQLQQESMNGAEIVAVAMAVAKCRLHPQQQWCEALEQSCLLLVQQSISQMSAAGNNSQQHRQRQQLQQLNRRYSDAFSSDTEHGAVDHAPAFVAAASEAGVAHDSSIGSSLQYHQHQQQAEQQYLQEWQLAMKPKEVSNTLLSLARLRHLPGQHLLDAVQMYQQQYSYLMNAADHQQLARALQSMADQRRARQQQEAAAAVLQDTAAAAGAEQADSCLQTNEPSSAAGADEEVSLNAAACTSSNNGCQAPNASSACTDSVSKDRHCHEQHVIGSSSRRRTSNNSSSGRSDWDLQPYGRYILHLGHENSAVRWQGAAAEDAPAAEGISSSSKGRSKALASVMQQAFLVAGGLSAAVS